ncbi:hypothetical protein JOF53_005797 [Crossiella equi]|uniref:Uncharacterized protein n=1 Tax=Crossiella equi TaxID=130796 RepID=A0ABS5AK33_9PSEU|nr:hypothetical protein [Crossiella equi]
MTARVRPPLRDTLLAGVVLLGLLLGALLEPGTVSGPIALASLVICLPLPWHRRAPVTVAVLCAAVAFLGTGLPGWSGRLVAAGALCAAVRLHQDRLATARRLRRAELPTAIANERLRLARDLPARRGGPPPDRDPPPPPAPRRRPSPTASARCCGCWRAGTATPSSRRSWGSGRGRRARTSAGCWPSSGCARGCMR